MILFLGSLLFVAINTWAHVTMDVVKDRRTHREYGHPYRSFWHAVQLARDSSAWVAGGLFLIFVLQLNAEEFVGLSLVYLGWLGLCKLFIFCPLYESGFYRDWCFFQDEYCFRVDLGSWLNEWMGFDYNPRKRSKDELDRIWLNMRNKSAKIG